MSRPEMVKVDESDVEEKKIFVGGLSWETTKDTLQEYFSQFGNVTDCVVMHSGDKPRGFGFVTFENHTSVEKALAIGDHFVDRKKIDPKPATKKGKHRHLCKLFAGGLAPTTTEEDIRAYFSQINFHVCSVEIKKNKEGTSKGFGFIELLSEDAVKEVLAKGQFHKINGKDVEMKQANPHEKQGGPNMYSNPMNPMMYQQQGYYNPGINRYEGSNTQYGAGSFGYPYSSNNYPPTGFPTGYSQQAAAGASAAAMYQNYGNYSGRGYGGQQTMSSYPQEGTYSQSRSGYGGTESYSGGAGSYNYTDQSYSSYGDQSGGGASYSRGGLSTQSRASSTYQGYGR